MDEEKINRVKKIIYQKIAMYINEKNLDTEDSENLEFNLRLSGMFSQAELNLIFGEREKSYYDMLERVRRRRIGLDDDYEEENQDKEIFKRAQEQKREKELEQMLKFADVRK